MIMSSLTTDAKIVARFVWYRTTLANVAHMFLTKVNMGALVRNC
jgi:hypothetical protein